VGGRYKADRREAIRTIGLGDPAILFRQYLWLFRSFQTQPYRPIGRRRGKRVVDACRHPTNSNNRASTLKRVTYRQAGERRAAYARLARVSNNKATRRLKSHASRQATMWGRCVKHQKQRAKRAAHHRVALPPVPHGDGADATCRFRPSI